MIEGCGEVERGTGTCAGGWRGRGDGSSPRKRFEPYHQNPTPTQTKPTIFPTGIRNKKQKNLLYTSPLLPKFTPPPPQKTNLTHSFPRTLPQPKAFLITFFLPYTPLTIQFPLKQGEVSERMVWGWGMVVRGKGSERVVMVLKGRKIRLPLLQGSDSGEKLTVTAILRHPTTKTQHFLQDR